MGKVWSPDLPAPRPALYAVEALTYRNNLGTHNTYGIIGDNTGKGLPSLAAYVKALTWSQNVLIGSDRTSQYPPATWFDLAKVPAGVAVGR